MELKPVKGLRPFTKFLMTIGELPSSYLVSMTYEEQLIWFCNYLQNVVIPTINNNGEAVEELQNKFIELKDYVDNYFENLDVQTEIDNKLDEMAESGELAEIVAEFLDVGVLFVYDTAADLGAAENVKDGTSAYILGKDTYDDGKGAFYKIREITISDVIDGDNIIAITNSEDLVAEKLPNYYINDLQSQITTITDTTIPGLQGDISGLDTRVEALETEPLIKSNIFIGTFFDGSTEKIKFVTSLDGENFADILPGVDLSGRDPQIVYDEENKKFYISCTWGSNTTDCDFTMYVTEDFETFETKKINLGILANRRWAPELFFDTDGTLYCFISVGTTDSDMSIYKAVCTDIETMTFNSASAVSLNGSSYIDANVTKYNDVYYMVVKDEISGKQEIYSSVNLTYWTRINSDILQSGEACEGGMMTIINGKFTFYGDTWQSFGYYITAQSDDPTSFTAFKRPNSLHGKRHGTVLYVTNQEAVKIITGLESYTNNLTVVKTRSQEYQLTGSYDELVVIPNFIYRITANTTITNLINAYNLEYMPFYFAMNSTGTLTINNVINSEYQTKAINKTIYNSHKDNEKLNKISLIGNPREDKNNNSVDLGIANITAGTGWTLSMYSFSRIGDYIYISGDLKRTSGSDSYALTLPSGTYPTYHVMEVTNKPGVTVHVYPNDGRLQVVASTIPDNTNIFISFRYYQR